MQSFRTVGGGIFGGELAGKVTKGLFPTSWYDNDSSLANSIIAHWKLNEASGNALDSVGSFTLTDNATVTSSTGIVYPFARQFVIANGEYLSAADTAALRLGDQLWWWSIRFKPTAVNVTSVLMGKFRTSDNTREWQLAQINNGLTFTVSSLGTAASASNVSIASSLIANTWVTAMGYHDPVNNLIGLTINGGEFVTASHSGGAFGGGAEFAIGRQSGAAAGTFFGGLIQEATIGVGVIPSVREGFDLYNRGIASGVASLYFIGYGREADVKQDATERIVFDRKDGDGVYQLHLIDRDSRNEVCISDPAVTGGPAVDRHKGFPYWHPTEDLIVCQVQISGNNGDSSLSEPGRGHQCDVWVCRADGSEWWQLTTYSGETVSGVLNPRFSPDGTKLLWARKIGAVVAETAPLGEWDLQIADFSLPGGVPTISNVATLTPGSGTFYEAHGFNRDSTRILYTSDAGLVDPYGLDVSSATVAGGSITNISNSATQWDEHGTIPAHADLVSFASSRMYPTFVAADDSLAQLKLEIVVANLDGTNRRQITHFNRVGFGEYNAEQSVATVNSWNAPGTRMVVSQLLIGDSYDTALGGLMWLVEFNGVYT